MNPNEMPETTPVTAREFEAALSDMRRALDVATETIEGQVSRRIETQQRELRDQRQHFDAILIEKARATEVAERERDKAATALAQGLAQSIKEGDDRLREHISNQILQINAALQCGDKLEQSRIQSLHDILAQEQNNAREAVGKAEVATERRFEAANAWREQSADRERSQQEQMAMLTNTFIPREVVDQLVAQLNQRIANLETTTAKTRGERAEIRRRQEVAQPWMIWALGAMLTIAVVMVNIIIKLSG